jgi:hypothetical protein
MQKQHWIWLCVNKVCIASADPEIEEFQKITTIEHIENY